MRKMLRTLRIILSIQNTININEILFAFRCIPVIGKYIPDRIYGARAPKIIALFFSLIGEFFRIFFGRICLFVFLFFASGAASSLNDYAQESFFLYGFLIISLIGVCIYNIFHIFTETKYTVFFIGMDAKEYILAKFLYESVYVFSSYTVFGIPAALLSGMKWYLAILIPFAGVGFKAATLGRQMAVYASRQARGKTQSKRGVPVSIAGNGALSVIFIVLLVIVGFAGITIVANTNLYPFLAAVLVVGSLCNIPGILLIRRFPYSLYRTALFAEQKRGEIIKEKEDRLNGKKREVRINETEEIRTGARGYRYLHEIFLKRHFGIFLKKIIVTSVITALGIALASVLLYFEIRSGRPEKSVLLYLITRHAGIFPFLISIVNFGAFLAHASFANCDSAMLVYSFYKTPKSLLTMYRLRVKSAILYSLIPGVMIAVFSIVVMALTGREINVFDYFFTLCVIVLSTVFFSVWHMAIYYLVQPYTSDIKVESKLYGFLSFLVGFVCTVMAFLPLNAFVLTVSGIIFTGLFIFISDRMVYKFAPKTFRVK